MDIKKARKLLGKEGKSLSDEQVSDCMRSMEVLADIVIDSYLALSPKERAKYRNKKDPR